MPSCRQKDYVGVGLLGRKSGRRRIKETPLTEIGSRGKKRLTFCGRGKALLVERPLQKIREARKIGLKEEKKKRKVGCARGTNQNRARAKNQKKGKNPNRRSRVLVKGGAKRISEIGPHPRGKLKKKTQGFRVSFFLVETSVRGILPRPEEKLNGCLLRRGGEKRTKIRAER